MSIQLPWLEILIRLLCAVAAGFFIGFDRGEHGRPAGLRTTLLVSLAACLAMIQANALLATAGKRPDSFVMLDLMRLPLGILSGMGFIGAGAIIRRDSGVLGVTTAATLWFATVLGLCFGGGQIGLGTAGLLIGMVVLAGLRPVEARLKQDRQGTLTVVTQENGPTVEEIRASLLEEHFGIASCAVVYTPSSGCQEVTYQLAWRANRRDTSIPDVVHSLAVRPGIVKIAWGPPAA